MAHSHFAEMLDLDAEVLHDYHRDVITWVGSLAPARPRIIDLGAGSGTGTLALARHLPQAGITAVDVDEEMLDHLRGRAEQAGVDDRVRTVAADLDREWPDLGPADLVWASASMHHMADPAGAFRKVFAALRPGGLFVVAELGSFPTFFAEPALAALEDRWQAAAAAKRAEAGLHMDADWSALLTGAGFAVEAERRFDIDLRPPLPAAAGRYAEVTLHRMRHGLADRLSAEDVATLDRLLVDIPSDLRIRATRTVFLGRRP